MLVQSKKTALQVKHCVMWTTELIVAVFKNKFLPPSVYFTTNSYYILLFHPSNTQAGKLGSKRPKGDDDKVKKVRGELRSSFSPSGTTDFRTL